MDFIFEMMLEIIMEPIVEAYTFAMMRISDKNKKINLEKIQAFVVFECIAIFVLFIVGGVMLLETKGESFVGKLVLLSSILISVSQIYSTPNSSPAKRSASSTEDA